MFATLPKKTYVPPSPSYDLVKNFSWSGVLLVEANPSIAKELRLRVSTKPSFMERVPKDKVDGGGKPRPNVTHEIDPICGSFLVRSGSRG